MTRLFFALYSFLSSLISSTLTVALAARRGGGRRSRATTIQKDHKRRSVVASTVSKPPRTKNVVLPIGQDQITVVQVDDPDWWDAQEPQDDDDNSPAAANPYGAKCWPSCLGVVQSFPSHVKNWSNWTVVELGCGTGLVSLWAARQGAHVVATDISPLALDLVRQGWQATRTLQQQSQQQQSQQSQSCGTLRTMILDLTTPKSVSNLVSQLRTTTNDRPVLVVAAAVLYEAALAEALAHRLDELSSLSSPPWIVVGDDDTGHRQGGRLQFEETLLRSRFNEQEVPWQTATVKCRTLGWLEKRVQVWQHNAPTTHNNNSSSSSNNNNNNNNNNNL